MGFYNAQRSLRIANNSDLRAALVRVLREGKGIEGEVCVRAIMCVSVYMSACLCGVCACACLCF